MVLSICASKHRKNAMLKYGTEDVYITVHLYLAMTIKEHAGLKAVLVSSAQQ